VGQKRPRVKLPRSSSTTERDLLEYPGAQEALARLTQECRVEKCELVRLLCEVPFASNQKQLLVTGMNDRALRALPNRVRKWAATIEQVNHSPFLDPKHITEIAQTSWDASSLRPPLNLIFTPELARNTAANFQRWPSILRLYADYLREWFPAFKYLGRHGFRFQTLLTLKLTKLLRDACGRPCHADLATLLEASFAAAGNPLTIAPDDLSKLGKNNLWLNALLHPELFQ